MNPEDDKHAAPPAAGAFGDLPSLVLIERLQGGETAARDELVRRYWPRLAAWARGRLPQRARDLYDTTDLVQEAFTAALPRLNEFRPEHEGALLAYLRVAVMNRIANLADARARRGQRVDADSEIEDRQPSPLERVIGRDSIERYERALERLKPRDRHAIQVRVELDLPYDEISRELGTGTITAARMRVSRALYRLAIEMNREAGLDARA